MTEDEEDAAEAEAAKARLSESLKRARGLVEEAKHRIAEPGAEPEGPDAAD